MTFADAPRRAVLSALLLGPRVGRTAWVGTVTFGLLGGALVPLGAWVTRSVINALGAPHIDGRHVIALAAAATAAAALGVVIGSLSSITAAAVQRRMILHMTSEMYTAVNQFHGLARFENPEFQDSMRLADGAGLSAAVAVTSALLASVSTVMSAAGFVYVLMVVWPPMAGLLLCVAIPSFLVQVRLARSAAEANKSTVPSVRKSTLFRSMLTDPRAAKETRLFGVEGRFRDLMLEDLDVANAREYQAARTVGFSQVRLTAIVGLAIAGGVSVVAYRAGGRQIGIGDFVLFLTAVATIQSGLANLAQQLPWVGRSIILYQCYLDLLAAPDSIVDGLAEVPPLRCSIEFQDVWFRYQESSDWVLRGASLTIAAGSSTGLIGLNGAGKSTLVKLLCRFYDPAKGRILWDGIDVRDFAVSELRKRITATFQDFVSFDLSAAECIGIGDIKHADNLNMIRAAARHAEIDDVLSALPSGYGTVLSRVFAGPKGDDCVLLSGGQSQRVALARAMMCRSPDLIILDEPSSGLDAEAESRITNTMRKEYAGRTSLLISHRLSVLRSSDMIAVLSNGAVAESGTHEELIALGGAYARLFGLQAAGYQAVLADDAVDGAAVGLRQLLDGTGV
jgi:ATP-binding cassette, subfamily B, bacterial